MEHDEFAQDRTIDPLALDVEAAQQADLFFKWAERSIEARSEMDEAKLKLDTTEARLAIECRKTPENFGLSKITEAAVAVAVKTADRYLNAYDNFLRAKETAGLLGQAVEAMEQKKRMIEVLITLHGQQYFAGPSVPRDLASAWHEHQAKAEADVNTRQRSAARQRKNPPKSEGDADD